MEFRGPGEFVQGDSVVRGEWCKLYNKEENNDDTCEKDGNKNDEDGDDKDEGGEKDELSWLWDLFKDILD